MTLFSKTVSQLDEIDKAVNAQKEVDRASISAIEQKIILSALFEDMNSIRPTADKFKKNADETDTEKKVYGPGMVKKVLAFYERFLAVDASLAEILDNVSAEAKIEQAAIDERKAEEEAKAAEAAALLKLAEEKEAKAAAAAALKLAEEKAKAAADAAAKQKAEAEAAEAAKKQAEAAKRATEEALAAAKKAEEEEALKVAASAAAKKAEEEETAKKAQEAAAAVAAAQKAEGEAAAVAAKKKAEEEAKRNATPPAAASQSLEEQARVAAAALSAALSAGVGDLAAGAATGGESNARGQVKVITQGAEELRQQLEGAANELVIVDWNASWCGPCQRIKPEFEKLAQKYTTCLFLSIDIQEQAVPQAPAPTPAAAAPPHPMGLGGADPLGLGLLGQMPGGGMPGGLGQMPGGMPPGGKVRICADREVAVSRLYAEENQASPANQAVASQAAVRSLPTFHFYRGSVRLEEFTGASLAKLEDTIQRLTGAPAGSPAEPPAAASPPTQAPVPSSDDLIAAVGEALGALKAACGFDDFVVATRTLLTFIGNVLKHPTDPKFRRVRLSNPSFQSRLGSRTGGIECMCAFGFERITENGEQILILSEAAAMNPALATVKSLLIRDDRMENPGDAEDSVPRGSGLRDEEGRRDEEGKSAISHLWEREQEDVCQRIEPALHLTGQMWGVRCHAAGGMAEMMQQMAQNPEMMQQMANNPMLQQMLPPHMQQQMQQMLANPEMMQQMLNNPMVTQMMNNPQMMQQMQQDMTNLFGGAGAPGAGGATPGMPDLFGMLGGAGAMGAEPAAGMTDEEMLAEAIRRSLEENPQPPP
eukprot:gene4630-5671_t